MILCKNKSKLFDTDPKKFYLFKNFRNIHKELDVEFTEDIQNFSFQIENNFQSNLV